jgi:outer membrane lipoprotein carrier protein
MKKPIRMFKNQECKLFILLPVVSFSRLFLLCIFSATAVVNPAFAQTVDEAVLAVEKHYRDLTDLTAKVSQKNVLKAVERTQKFDGTLWIKKPGKLRLEYTNGQLILIDGKAALFYSKRSEQVIKRTFTDFAHMNIPVAFLLGAAHIRDDFDVRGPDPKTPRVLDLLPKKAGAAMKKLRIHADDAGRITEMTIFDKSGNTTEIVFNDVKEGTGVEDKLFEFKAPKGTEIIEQ